jgi:hypothetical protein
MQITCYLNKQNLSIDVSFTTQQVSVGVQCACGVVTYIQSVTQQPSVGVLDCACAELVTNTRFIEKLLTEEATLPATHDVSN